MLSLYPDAVALRGAYFGKGRGPILMEGVYCAGDEKELHNCFQSRSQPCSHIEDAAVRCSGLHDYKSQTYTVLFILLQCYYFPGPSAVPKDICKLNISRLPDHFFYMYIINISVGLVNVTSKIMNKAVVTVVLQTNQVLTA